MRKKKPEVWPWVLELDGVERAHFMAASGGLETMDRFSSPTVDTTKITALALCRGITDCLDLHRWAKREHRGDIRTFDIVGRDEIGTEVKRLTLHNAHCDTYDGVWDEEHGEARITAMLLVPSVIEDVPL